MISFKANIINYSTLIKKESQNKETPFIASFVELDTLNKDDFKALQTIAKTWEKGGSFAFDMYSNFKHDFRSEGAIIPTNFKYFAMLKEDTPNRILDSDSILGVISYRKDENNSFSIEQVQVNPKQIYTNPDRNIRHIGKQMLISIQNLLSSKTLKVFAVDEAAEKFYLSLGFKKKRNSKLLFFKR